MNHVLQISPKPHTSIFIRIWFGGRPNITPKDCRKKSIRYAVKHAQTKRVTVKIGQLIFLRMIHPLSSYASHRIQGTNVARYTPYRIDCVNDDIKNGGGSIVWLLQHFWGKGSLLWPTGLRLTYCILAKTTTAIHRRYSSASEVTGVSRTKTFSNITWSRFR